MEWYKVKDRKPSVGEIVLVSTSLFDYTTADVAMYCIDEKGVAWWKMRSRACPDVTDDDQWACFSLPNK